VDELEYDGQPVEGDFDRAVSWMHTYTIEADPTEDVCLNCHDDEVDEVSWREEEWTEHAMKGRTSRQTMDRVEADLGIGLDPDASDRANRRRTLNTLCESCHDDESDEISCTGSDGREWKEHLTEGRVSVEVWEFISRTSAGTGNTTCGW
jgi:hypothetical protein